MNYKSTIINDLRTLGIMEGDSILVHSSLNSIGRFSNRAQILIEAFKELLGEFGTLLMPSLSYEYVTRNKPEFDLKITKSCVGGLTEYFRLLSSTKRSLHPTHSVSGFGKNINFLLDNHFQDNTPVGKNSPFSKLKEIDGKILFLGCGIKPNTSMHGVEENVIPPYLFDKEIQYTLILENGQKVIKKYIPHNFEGYEQRYDRLLDLLNRSDYNKGNVLEAECYLLRSEAIWEKALKIMKENPLHFVEKI